MFEIGGRKDKPEPAVYIIGVWEGQEAGTEEGLQEFTWEADEFCTVKCQPEIFQN